MKAGCYPADEEVEDFIFADGTHSALLTFQVQMMASYVQWPHITSSSMSDLTALQKGSPHPAAAT